MGKRLLFDDIDEWTPSSISIVDEPFHPLCHFEVYEDDDEYVKKSIEITNEGENMAEETPTQEPKVEVSESFLERILGRSITKSDEAPKKDEEEEVSNKDIMDKLQSFDERISALEEDKKKESAEPVQGAVEKSEGETAEPSEEETLEDESTEEETETVDDEEVVTKSIDPDIATQNVESEKSFCERMGRKDNGMSW